ncbi:uncharacterized protein LOC132736008 [Ruditapes philippinarum]|uniref:uncharacterized protein LOC132736008 n=1 Tax=Ruditapes philippinarum TaxID=129788 RepID=UPI00295B8C43|nr:uncharacterized protein LOC132736008 [Ruditapes philippinarum]
MAYSRIDFSASFTQDSDEVQEMFCEVCDKHNKQYAPAEGFCEECFQYLCVTCLKYHKIYMKSHTIKDKDNMPQDFCLEKCSVHQDELVKFYCQACKKFACTECKTQDHGTCSMVSHLPALVPGIENSQEIKELTENLDMLMEDLENTEKYVNINMKYVASQEIKILDTVMKKKKKILSVFENHQKEIIQDFEQEIEDTLKRLKEEKTKKIEKLKENQRKLEKLLNDEENEIKKKIEIIKKNDKTVLQAITEKTSKMKIKLKAISTELVHYQNTDQRCQLFVAMKKGQEIIEQLKPDIDKQWENNSIHYYKVKCKASKRNITNLQDCDTFFTYQEIHESEVPRTASCHTDIKFKSDSFASLLNSFSFYAPKPFLCLLSENCLLVTNLDRDKLSIFKDMLVSTTSYDTIDLPSNPWAAAKVDNNKVAVTFPRLEIIRLITFSKSMTVTNTEDIKVGGGCRGVAYSNNKLIVSYKTRSATVKILDMSGKVLKIFVNDHHGNCLFADPHLLTISADNTVIYVSDFEKNCVMGLTFNGKVKAIYKDYQLNKPCQLTVDRSGAVFVCGRWSQNIHQLSPNLTKVNTLLGKERAVAVAHCQNTNRLYVLSQLDDNIKVFDLSLE